MFSSVAQSCLTLCNPMNRSMPGLPVHHKLPEFTQTDSCNLVLKKGSSSNKSQLGEERKGIREKGRWPHSDTCCRWDTPSSRKQFRVEESHHLTKPVRFLSPPLYIRFTHDLGEIKHLALRNHLEPPARIQESH